jgi:lysozyme family protein
MKIIIQHEGGFVNNLADPGGATNMGISLRYLKGQQLLGDLDHDGDIDIEDIRKLTSETVMPFYLSCFYSPMRIENFISNELALQVFDFGVNAGPSRAIKTLQKLLKVKTDGIVGSKTIHFANMEDLLAFSATYCNERQDFYRSLVKQKPSLEPFLKGWIARAIHCCKTSKT